MGHLRRLTHRLAGGAMKPRLLHGTVPATGRSPHEFSRQRPAAGARPVGRRRVGVLSGVYEALASADILPDWVCGISIGAVNAALIAGNPPERRLERLTEFWDLTSARLALLPKPATPPCAPW